MLYIGADNVRELGYGLAIIVVSLLSAYIVLTLLDLITWLLQLVFDVSKGEVMMGGLIALTVGLLAYMIGSVVAPKKKPKRKIK